EAKSSGHPVAASLGSCRLHDMENQDVRARRAFGRRTIRRTPRRERAARVADGPDRRSPKTILPTAFRAAHLEALGAAHDARRAELISGRVAARPRRSFRT